MAGKLFSTLKQLLASSLVLSTMVWSAAIVEQTHQGPTGYQVTFRYHPPANSPAPQNVSMGSGFLYTDPLSTSAQTSDEILPSMWKPGDINFGSYTKLISGQAPSFDMAFDKGSGDWVLTLPFPAGTFQYSFLVNCAPPVLFCTGTIDADNPPIQQALGEQASSVVQVPFDSQFQTVDLTWQLPLTDASKRGNITFMNYTSPGSTYPASDVHRVGVYLPNGYTESKTYPVVYFHHGINGNHADWFNQGRLHNIVDRLIDAEVIPPVIIITPSFYDLGFTIQDFATGVSDYHYTTYDQLGIYAFDSAVRENYFKYLMPWVESTFSVAREAANRSFVGLSMGGGLTAEMLWNATDYFDTYGLFSQVPFVNPVPAGSAEAFSTKTLLFGAGLYDFALPSTLNAETVLANAGVIQFKNHVPICGGHSWCVWQELAYVFFKDVYGK